MPTLCCYLDIINVMIDKELSEILPIIDRVLIATICGFIIGIDRELKQKVAGIRTNVLICVGCTILTVMSFKLVGSDPGRIIGQIVTGIGFLGGGVIFKSEDKITGVTTAAFIWVMSAIGIMVGYGYTFIPIILTIGLFLLSRIFEKIEVMMKPNK